MQTMRVSTGNMSYLPQHRRIGLPCLADLHHESGNQSMIWPRCAVFLGVYLTWAMPLSVRLDLPFWLNARFGVGVYCSTIMKTLTLKTRVFATYQILCWNGKHINISMKPTNSPTRGQPNPRKNRLKRGILGHFFPQSNNIPWVGIDFIYRKQTTRNPTKPHSPPTPYDVLSCLSLIHI